MIINGEQWWAEMMAWDGAQAEWEIQRDTLQQGQTFSEEAMSQLLSQVAAFIGTRVARRWDATNEPPTVLRVEITVVAG